MKLLVNKFKDEAVWIVGKGPSLQYLRKEHILSGPIITLNQAILAVENLNFPNPIFSLQKDGGNKLIYDQATQSLICLHSPNCGNSCEDMVRPKEAFLMVDIHESLYCFPDYTPRLVYDWADFGMVENEFSLVIAIKIGQLMGCSKFVLVCCDAHAGGESDKLYIPNVGVVYEQGLPLYKAQIDKLKPFLSGLDVKFIMPESNDESR